MFTTNDISNEIWLGTGGAMLVMLRSIIDGTRRSWGQLMVGCILGGAGAAAAGFAFSGSSYIYFWCGVAAVMAENVVLGLFNASKEFRDSPIKVFSQIWKIVMPTFKGVNAGGSDAAPLNPDEVPAG